MREAAFLIRASWLARTSYRLRTVFGMAGILVAVVPLYFVANALQPVMEESIRGQADQYFGFVVIGLVSTYLVSAAVGLLPATVGGGIAQGTFEALLGTPASLTSILTGMIGAGLVWTGLRALVLGVAAWILGASIDVGGIVTGGAVLALILLAYLPFGLIAAALVLVFRTAGPFPRAVSYVSILLGGVYYPTDVIPSWLQDLSTVIPLTYGLRAARRLLLEGAAPGDVAGDVALLAGFAVALFALGTAVFGGAFRYARRAGTLTQY